MNINLKVHKVVAAYAWPMHVFSECMDNVKHLGGRSSSSDFV